jgi:hypothetical protein
MEKPKLIVRKKDRLAGRELKWTQIITHADIESENLEIIELADAMLAPYKFTTKIRRHPFLPEVCLDVFKPRNPTNRLVKFAQHLFKQKWKYPLFHFIDLDFDSILEILEPEIDCEIQ